MRGATDNTERTRKCRTHFNPRTPCGVRRSVGTTRQEGFYISIHAPHAGCDLASLKNNLASSQFQSTHPMRGATARYPVRACLIFISIHAPHAGCDVNVCRRAVPVINFNPRTPCGVRLAARSGVCTRPSISIHAPHAGCDLKNVAPLGRGLFQSTHPMRGATSKTVLRLTFDLISIHAPHAGCDFFHKSRFGTKKKFQSTHPMRGATIILLISASSLPISIHAPHAGCDPGLKVLAPLLALNFNPRTPCGVRRRSPLNHGWRYFISIHAPHAGCDPLALLMTA